MKLSKRVFLVFICIALILPTAVVTASAEESICVVEDNTEKLSTTVNENGLTVFGYFGGKGGYPVTITVKNAETGIEDYFQQTTTEALGYYCVRFPYDASMLGNSYVISVRSIAEKVIYQKTVSYIPGTETSALLTALEEAVQSNTMEEFVREYGSDAGVSYASIEALADSESAYKELESNQYQTLADFQKSFREIVKNGEQQSADARQIHVAIGGSNSNNGSLENPMATLLGALTYVDYLIKTGSKENFEILLHEGSYKVSSGIVIEKKESRTNHITIKNYNDEHVLLDGTKNISGWEQYKGNIYYARVPMDVNIDVLYENNAMLTKARYPNKQASPENLLDEYLEADSYNNSKSQFMYKAGALPSITSAKDLEVAIFSGGPTGYYMWRMNLIGVKDLSESERLITLERDTSYEIGTGSRYYFQGALGLLDVPGEFYHDTENGYVYYYPTDGSIEGKTISYPVVDNLVTIANKDGSTVSNITIEGIELCGSNRNEKEYLANQSGGNSSGNGIYIKNAKNIAVMNCEIHSMGGNAIGAEGNISGSVISGNLVHHNGGGGIIMTADANENVKDNVIDNNYVHHQCLIIHSDSGIEIYGREGAHIDGNSISHNRLSDLKRCGIEIYRADGDNFIEYNDVSSSCNGTDDSGMIYVAMTTGTTTIRNNYIHDSYSRCAYRGIYLDEGSHNTIVEKNLITRLDGYCYALINGKGDDIQIVNNYLVNNPNIRDAVITSETRYETTERMVIEKNIVYNSGDMLYCHYSTGDSTQRISRSDKNLFYNPNGVYKAKYGSNEYDLSLYKILKQYEKNSKTQDPVFLGELEENDVRYAYTSVAKELEIEPLDLENMGIREGYIYQDADKHGAVVFTRDVTSPFAAGFVIVDEGKNVQLKSLVRNEKGFVIPSEDVTYTYSVAEPKGVVTISSDGNVKGIKEGSVRAKVTAVTESGTVEGEFDIVVLPNELNKVKLESINVTNKNDTILNTLEPGELSVKVSLMAKEDTNVTVFLSYDGKTSATDAYGVSETINLAKGASGDVSTQITVPQNPDGKLYLFIWSDTQTLRPLYRKIELFNE